MAKNQGNQMTLAFGMYASGQNCSKSNVVKKAAQTNFRR